MHDNSGYQYSNESPNDSTLKFPAHSQSISHLRRTPSLVTMDMREFKNAPFLSPNKIETSSKQTDLSFISSAAKYSSKSQQVSILHNEHQNPTYKIIELEKLVIQKQQEIDELAQNYLILDEELKQRKSGDEEKWYLKSKIDELTKSLTSSENERMIVKNTDQQNRIKMLNMSELIEELEDANKNFAINDEIKHKKIDELTKINNHLKEINEDLIAKLGTAKKINDDLYAKCNRSKEILDDSQLKFVKNKEVTDDLTSKLKKLSQVNEDLSMNLSKAKEINDELSSKLKKSYQANEELSMSLSKNKEISEELSNKVNKLEKEKNELLKQQQNERQLYLDLKTRNNLTISALETDKGSLNGQINQLLADLANLKNENSNLKSSIDIEKAANLTLRADFDKEKAFTTYLKSEIESDRAHYQDKCNENLLYKEKLEKVLHSLKEAETAKEDSIIYINHLSLFIKRIPTILSLLKNFNFASLSISEKNEDFRKSIFQINIDNYISKAAECPHLFPSYAESDEILKIIESYITELIKSKLESHREDVVKEMSFYSSVGDQNKMKVLEDSNQELNSLNIEYKQKIYQLELSIQDLSARNVMHLNTIERLNLLNEGLLAQQYDPAHDSLRQNEVKETLQRLENDLIKEKSLNKTNSEIIQELNDEHEKLKKKLHEKKREYKSSKSSRDLIKKEEAVQGSEIASKVILLENLLAEKQDKLNELNGQIEKEKGELIRQVHQITQEKNEKIQIISQFYLENTKLHDSLEIAKNELEQLSKILISKTENINDLDHQNQILIHSLKEIEDSLNHKKDVIEMLEVQLKSQKKEFEVEIGEKQKIIFEADSKIQEQYALLAVMTNSIEQIKKEKTELQQALDIEKEKEKKFEEELNQANVTINQISIELSLANQNLIEKNHHIDKLVLDSSKKEEDLNSIVIQKNTLSSELKNALNEKNKLEEKIKCMFLQFKQNQESNKENVNFRNNSNAHDKIAEQFDVTESYLDNEIAKIQDMFAQHMTEIDHLNNDKQNGMIQINQFLKINKDLEAELSKLKTEINDLKHCNEELESEKFVRNLRIKHNEFEIQILNKKINEFIIQSESTQPNSNQNSGLLQMLKTELIKFYDFQEKVKLNLTELYFKIEKLTNSIQDLKKKHLLEKTKFHNMTDDFSKEKQLFSIQHNQLSQDLTNKDLAISQLHLQLNTAADDYSKQIQLFTSQITQLQNSVLQLSSDNNKLSNDLHAAHDVNRIENDKLNESLSKIIHLEDNLRKIEEIAINEKKTMTQTIELLTKNIEQDKIAKQRTISAFVELHNKMDVIFSNLNDDVIKLQQQNELLHKQIESMSAEKNIVENDSKRLQDELEECKVKLNLQKAEIDGLEEKNMVEKKAGESLRDCLQRLEEEYKVKMHESSKELEKTQSTMKNLEEKLESIQNEKNFLQIDFISKSTLLELEIDKIKDESENEINNLKNAIIKEQLALAAKTHELQEAIMHHNNQIFQNKQLYEEKITKLSNDSIYNQQIANDLKNEIDNLLKKNEEESEKNSILKNSLEFEINILKTNESRLKEDLQNMCVKFDSQIKQMEILNKDCEQKLNQQSEVICEQINQIKGYEERKLEQEFIIEQQAIQIIQEFNANLYSQIEFQLESTNLNNKIKKLEENQQHLEASAATYQSLYQNKKIKSKNLKEHLKSIEMKLQKCTDDLAATVEKLNLSQKDKNELLLKFKLSENEKQNYLKNLSSALESNSQLKISLATAIEQINTFKLAAPEKGLIKKSYEIHLNQDTKNDLEKENATLKEEVKKMNEQTAKNSEELLKIIDKNSDEIAKLKLQLTKQKQQFEVVVKQRAQNDANWEIKVNQMKEIITSQENKINDLSNKFQHSEKNKIDRFFEELTDCDLMQLILLLDEFTFKKVNHHKENAVEESAMMIEEKPQEDFCSNINKLTNILKNMKQSKK